MASHECMVWAKNPHNQQRIKYFMQKAATAIIGEEGTTAGHAERVAFSSKILGGSASVLEYTIAVTTNQTIAAAINAATEPSDNDIEFTVNSMINDFAGYDGV